jgi:hypothetical protein
VASNGSSVQGHRWEVYSTSPKRFGMGDVGAKRLPRPRIQSSFRTPSPLSTNTYLQSTTLPDR